MILRKSYPFLPKGTCKEAKRKEPARKLIERVLLGNYPEINRAKGKESKKKQGPLGKINKKSEKTIVKTKEI